MAASGNDTARAGVPRTFFQRLKLILKVLEVRVRFIAILVATGFVIGYWENIKNHWDKWVRPTGVALTENPDNEFFCPMHPNVVRPGLDPNGEEPKCPICGMPLSERKKGIMAELPPGITGRVQLSPERIRLAGITSEVVAYQPLAKEVATVGYVRYDESRLSTIVTRAAGYLEKLHVDKTFQTVTLGQPLAEIYSPDLHAAAQELVIASRSGASGDLTAATRKRLGLLGVGDAEIDAIAASGQADARLLIRSPQHGHVIRKAVTQGAHVETGATLFEIADLRTVWIEAEVYEKDLAFLEEGREAEAVVEAYPNRVFTGKVSRVYPRVDSATRTNSVRIAVENPSLELRPGMAATVRIRVPLVEIEPFRKLSIEAASRRDELLKTGLGEFFTCPTHSEVIRERAGRCPECGAVLIRKPVPDNSRLVWRCPRHPNEVSNRSLHDCAECLGTGLGRLSDADRKAALAQSRCPITGEALGTMGTPDILSLAGRQVFLCCGGCRGKAAADPVKTLAALDHRHGPSDNSMDNRLLPVFVPLVRQGEVLSLPERSVIDTGARKIVYVERIAGLFEGVPVELGPRVGAWYPVIAGVQPGDRVASAGAFLVDAETRLNPAVGATFVGAGSSPGAGTSPASPARTDRPAAEQKSAP